MTCLSNEATNAALLLLAMLDVCLSLRLSSELRVALTRRSFRQDGDQTKGARERAASLTGTSTKQGSGYCGTGEMLHRWGQAPTAECPNCGRFEKVSHLNMCPSPHQRKLLERSITTLTEWIKDNYTHLELVEKIPAFIRAQGRRLFINLGTMSWSMRRMAHAIEKIGWTHFTEGKIPLLLKDLQANYLAHCHPSIVAMVGQCAR